MKQEMILTGINLEDFFERIDTLIKVRLQEGTTRNYTTQSASKYFSRKEVASLLKISLPTLHQWTKEKILQSYKIGSRVLYKQEEVEQTLSRSSSIKFKKNRP